jgi:hypothetical protein
MESSVNDLNFILSEVKNPITNPEFFPVVKTVTWDSGNNTVAIVPGSYLKEDTTYQVIVVGDHASDGVKVGVLSITGDTMDGSHMFQFQTETYASTTEDTSSTSDDTTTAITRSGNLEVIQTDPINHQMYVQDTGVSILFNDQLILDSGVYDTYNNLLETQEDYLNNKVTVYRTNVLGTDSDIYATPMVKINYTYEINQKVLRLGIGEGRAELYNNRRYVVTINPGMSGVSTYPMQATHQFSFTTPLLPSYTTIERIRLQYGDMLSGFSDQWIAQIIHKYSTDIYEKYKEAGKLLPVDPNISGQVVPDYVKQWVYCSTKLDLIKQIIGKVAASGAGTVRLGDFSYSGGEISKVLTPLMSRLDDCIKNTSHVIDSHLHKKQIAMIPHYYDPRSPWHDRGGRFERTTMKGDAEAQDEPRY